MSDILTSVPICVVRMDRRTRNSVAAIWCFFAGVMAVGLVLSLTGVVRDLNRFSTLLTLALIAICLLLILALLRNRVALFADCIEVTRDLAPRRRVFLNDIIARRQVPSGYRRAPYCVLVTHSGEVNLPPYLENNADFQHWLEKIPLQSGER
jgi:hypothetical protein